MPITLQLFSFLSRCKGTTFFWIMQVFCQLFLHKIASFFGIVAECRFSPIWEALSGVGRGILGYWLLGLYFQRRTSKSKKNSYNYNISNYILIYYIKYYLYFNTSSCTPEKKWIQYPIFQYNFFSLALGGFGENLYLCGRNLH